METLTTTKWLNVRYKRASLSMLSKPRILGLASKWHFRTRTLCEADELASIPKVTAHFADVSDPQSVQSSVNAILKAHGRIDHLITAAGFVENFNAVEYPSDRMKRLFAVNFDGTYYFATAVARHLLERRAKGSMVMIGSISSVVVMVPQPQAPYNASKAAVRQLCASLAVEWADAGIRVNCINPGYFRTAL